MSHHSSEPSEAVKKIMESIPTTVLDEHGQAVKLGATGDHPAGKYDATDEGGINLAVAADCTNGKVVINFGTPVVWVGMTPDDADGLAESLRAMAYACRAVSGVGRRRPDGTSAHELHPYEYARNDDGVWVFCTPSGLHGSLARHHVTEHEDGTITVTPSVRVVRGPDESWHGYVERGVWRDAE